MRKLIAAINVTLDGFCNHEAMIADDEIHEHYNDLLRSADTLVYGRVVYELMASFWPTIVNKPTGNKAIDDFAVLIDEKNKVVFSHSLTKDDPIVRDWKNVIIAEKELKEEIISQKNLAGKDIVVGSPSLIIACLNLGLVDEFQISIQPMILGKGKRLFQNIDERINLKLIKTKTFVCGAVTHYYVPTKI